MAIHGYVAGSILLTDGEKALMEKLYAQYESSFGSVTGALERECFDTMVYCAGLHYVADLAKELGRME